MTERTNIEKDICVPIWKKLNLTIKEAVAYSGIGENCIREIVKENVPFVLKNGNRKLIKRREFEEWLSDRQVI